MPLDATLRVTVSGSYGTGLNDSGCTKQLVERKNYHCFFGSGGGSGDGSSVGMRNAVDMPMHRCASGDVQLGFVLFLPAEVKHTRMTDRTLKGYASQFCVHTTSACMYGLNLAERYGSYPARPR
jgi:hypothetical protein